MSKFERVLSDVDFMEILSKTNGFSPTSDGEVYVGSGDDVWFALADFAEKVEQATIAALKEQQEEQDPVATLKVDSVSGIDVIYHRFQGLYDGMKLYAHPAPALEPDYYFYKGKLHCNDGGTHLNHGAKEHGRPLYAHPIPETKEHRRTANNHIPDGWQLVPVEADQALLVSMATCLNHGFGLLAKEDQDSQLYDMRKLHSEVVGKGYYSQENRGRYLSMLSAPSKYTGE